MTTHPSRDRDIPVATVSRLPLYLRALADFTARGVTSLSSEELAGATGVRSTQLRKDLSHLGSHGVRGVGYDPARLAGEIASVLGLSRTWPLAIVGMGNLGRALAAYSGFATKGFPLVALFDRDPSVVGQRIGSLTVCDMTSLPELVRSRGIAIGVIATPSGSAQAVADALVAAGLHALLNFAPTTVTAAGDVTIRRVDIATELHVLAFRREQQRLGGVEVAG